MPFPKPNSIFCLLYVAPGPSEGEVFVTARVDSPKENASNWRIIQVKDPAKGDDASNRVLRTGQYYCMRTVVALAHQIDHRNPANHERFPACPLSKQLWGFLLEYDGGKTKRQTQNMQNGNSLMSSAVENSSVSVQVKFWRSNLNVPRFCPRKPFFCHSRLRAWSVWMQCPRSLNWVLLWLPGSHWTLPVSARFAAALLFPCNFITSWTRRVGF